MPNPGDLTPQGLISSRTLFFAWIMVTVTYTKQLLKELKPANKADWAKKISDEIALYAPVDRTDVETYLQALLDHKQSFADVHDTLLSSDVIKNITVYDAKGNPVPDTAWGTGAHPPVGHVARILGILP